MFAERPFVLDELFMYGVGITPEEVRGLARHDNLEPVKFHRQYVASGADSVVFKAGGFAYKFYVGDIGNRKNAREQLILYRDAVNYLYAKTHEEEVGVHADGEWVRVIVNPIDRLGYSRDYGCHVSISPFIDGEHVLSSGLPIEVNKQAERWMIDMGIKGLQILSCNMKIQGNTEKTAIITDICTTIRNIGIMNHAKAWVYPD